MKRVSKVSSVEVVRLSFWTFATWWIILFVVHAVTCVYNALYAYCYLKLGSTYLNLYLEFYHVGMPHSNHRLIANVHLVMSVAHGICILLMLGGSCWQRSLAFSPWTSSTSIQYHGDGRLSSVVAKTVSMMYNKLSDRRGLFGVNSQYFHVVLVCREAVETALQTFQAYRMSALLPRTLLNRFYVLLLVVNCWSSVIIYCVLFNRNEARRRFACIVMDCVLDLAACMGVVLIILLSYASDYNPEIQSFSEKNWIDNEWVVRAMNEFRMVVVVSWSDLASRSIFSLGLIMTTTSMKELLQCLPQTTNRVLQSTTGAKISNEGPQMPTQRLLNRSDSYNETQLGTQAARSLLRTVHLLFGVWGVLVLGFHIHAAIQPTLPQCLMQVRPWAVSRPSCYIAGLDCHTLGISGTMEEVEAEWSAFDASTVVQLIIRHCSALQIPAIFSNFKRLQGIKVYNTTIVDWGESAALSNTNHPELSSLFIVRVNMTDGLLPKGFQSADFPRSMNDIEFCVTNLRELPDNLDTKWPTGAIIQFEYSFLSTVSPVLTRLKPFFLFLTGNPITELPPEVFEIEGMMSLGISETDISELPQNVTQVSSTLSFIKVDNTEISFFWSWTDELIERMENPSLVVAGVTPYCEDLEKIENGEAEEFRIPISTEYSRILMDPTTEDNFQVISLAIDCTPLEESPYYPLAYDDAANALQPPL